MSQDRTAILDALNVLVSDPDARPLYQSLVAVASLQIAHPAFLAGEAAVLNPLVSLYRSDPDLFDRYIGKVEVKRREALLAPLKPPEPEGFDKVEYMRQFMQAKRVRMRRAAEIENLTRPARDALVGRARLDFMDRVAAGWKQELDKRIDTARAAHPGGRLPKEVDTMVRQQFWAKIDDDLDRAEQAARDSLRK